MGSMFRATLMGLVCILGIKAWGQSDIASTQPVVTSVTFSSSQPQHSLETIASANIDPMPVIIRSGSVGVSPALIAAPIAPAQKPDTADRATQSRNKKIWFSLAAVEHTAAGFDAWSTRRGIGVNAQESNPLLKPFANSGAMYPATQVVPVGMDLLAHYMMRSGNPVVRKLWWLPQTASTVVSVASGLHNLSF
jgi:hypothetical protein